MTRVLHTADTHLGYRQYHSPERRRDFAEAFERVAEDAVAADVDAVVHAGDLFHDRRPDLRDLMDALGVLRRLDDAGIPFLAVVGNHESTRGGQWLDLFERLGLATRLGDEPCVVGETAFYGLDHVPQSRRGDLDYEFAPTDATHAALVAHGLFEPFAHADWDTERVLSASTVDFDALLLGDNHAPGTEQVDGTWVTYPGSTERASASEREPRGYNLVTFDGEVDVRRRTLDTRSFVFVDVDLGPDEGAERVRERVSEHDLTEAVVIVTVSGDGEPVTPGRVEEAARDDGALVARVTDRREVDSEREAPDVNFADPDDAVRERIEGMGLSTAGRDVDEVVRASEVADSNVRGRVKRRVEERLEDGVGTFERTDEETTDDGGKENEAPTDGADDDSTDGGADDPSDEVDDPATEAAADGAADGDGQVSMEDYL